MNQIIFIAISVLVLLGATGWGLVFSKKLQLESNLATKALLGLGIFYFVSGVLSYFCLFTQVGAWLFFLLGLGAFLYSKVNLSPLKSYWFFGSLAVINVFYLMLSTNSAPNPHDDLQKYFLHPWSLVNSGTFLHNPFSVIGYETMGGMGFLHSVYWGLIKTKHLLYVDFYLGINLIAIFAYSLLGKPREKLAFLIVIALLLFPNQVVNSSPVYLPIVTICTLLYYLLFGSATKNGYILLALLAYSLLLYKTLYILYLPVLFILGFIFIKPTKDYSLTIFKMAILGFILFLPWLPTMVDIIFSRVPLPKIPFGEASFLPPISLERLFYGGSTVYFILLFLSSLLITFTVFKRNPYILLAPLTIFLTFCLYWVSPLSSYLSSDHCLRYILPPLFATFIFAIIAGVILDVIRPSIGIIIITIIFLSSSPIEGLRVIFGYQTLRVDGTRFDDAYGQSQAPIHHERYSQELNRVLDLIPENSKVGVYVQNASIINEPQLDLLAYEFTSNPASLYSFDSLDYFIWEIHPDASMSPKKVTYHDKQPDWLSRRFAQGIKINLFPLFQKPTLYKSKRFALYQIKE